GDLSAVVGPDRLVGIGRELTKTHDELVVQPIKQLIEGLRETRGEFTVLLTSAEPASGQVETPPAAVDPQHELGPITESTGVGRREGLKVLASRYGLGVNELYRMLQDEV